MGGISTGVRTSPRTREPLGSICPWVVCGGGVVAHCWVVDQQAQHPWWVVVVGYFLEHHRSRLWVVGGVGGLLFVNYIVDASIFERRAVVTVAWCWFSFGGSGGGCGCGCVVCIFDDYLCCVAYKLLRAHGGCLGIRS